MKPLCYCLYAGLHGWEEGFVSEGYRCIGFDIEDMCALLGQPRPNDCELVLRDVRSIHGAELKDADCIVGSSPCQEFSYRAMPWSRAKALPPPYLGMELFNAQFRIQREASEAAGRYIPMVVENVRGAQKWVGRAKWHFGSYYLWGDVPALMPMTFKMPGERWPEFVKGVGIGSRSWAEGNLHPNDPRNFWSQGIKQHGSGREWFAGEGKISRMTSSKSASRKAASALIAKIPFALAQHIAKTMKATQDGAAAREGNGE